MNYYPFSTNRKVNRWKSFTQFVGLLVVAFGIPFLLATNSIDTLHTTWKSFTHAISSQLEEFRMSTKNSASLLRFNQSYMDSLAIDDILPIRNTYTIDDLASSPRVGAEAYIVGDVETGEIILAHNEDKILPIASVTKLMTALVALQEIDETEMTNVSVQATRTESARGMLRAHENIAVSDLLYPLLLVSSNDAGEALAEEKGRDDFIKAMNTHAQTIGMRSTMFDDPSGLSPDNTASPRDLFTLTQHVFQNHPIIFDITKIEEYTYGGRTWKNSNRFVGNEQYRGGKTGYTSKAGRTGVALFDVDFGTETRTIAIAVLNTENRTQDYQNILTFLTKHVIYEQHILEENKIATLRFLGDAMFDRGVASSVTHNFNGDVTKLFDNLSLMKEADVAFLNLEGPISDRGTNVGSKYSFRFQPSVASALQTAGIDIVSFANNHVGDWSLVAFKDTLEHLSKHGIIATGAGHNTQEAEQVDIIESNGVKIGFLGFSDVGPEWIEAQSDEAGHLLAHNPKREEIIQNAHKQVDILVVSYHWGEEYKEVTERQKTLAHTSIDAGADIVIGHHPHVIQGVERYKNGIIAYSLGNTIFDQHFSEETMQGMLFEVVVQKQGIEQYQEYLFSINEHYQPETPKSIAQKTITELTNPKNLEEDIMKALETVKVSCPRGKQTPQDFILTNLTRDNALPHNFIPPNLLPIPEDLIPTQERTICVHKEALTALYDMYLEARADGVSLVPTSGYRSRDVQSILFERSDNHKDKELLSIAEPGHSEHHLGTTIDFTSSEIGFESASPKFTNTKTYEWLKEHGPTYGFIQSYQDGHEDINGYIAESWHWRYIGKAHAHEIQRLNLPLAKYLETRTQ